MCDYYPNNEALKVSKVVEKGKEIASNSLERVKNDIPEILKDGAKKIVKENESIDSALCYVGEKTIVSAANGCSDYIITDVNGSLEKLRDNIKVKSKSVIESKMGDNAGSRVLLNASDKICDSTYSIMTDCIEMFFKDDYKIEDVFDYAGERILKEGEKLTFESSEMLIDELKKSAIDLLQSSDNPALQYIDTAIIELTKNNTVVQIVEFAKANGQTIVKLIEGDITFEQFAEEIIINGVLAISSTVIQIAVPIPFVGVIISNFAVKIAQSILDTKAHLNDYLIKEKIIIDLSAKAQADMKLRRTEFHNMVENEFDKWDKTTEEAFNQILCNSFDENFSFEKMIEGLDKIMSLFGEESRFHSVNEWERQLDLPFELSF